MKTSSICLIFRMYMTRPIVFTMLPIIYLRGLIHTISFKQNCNSIKALFSVKP